MDTLTVIIGWEKQTNPVFTLKCFINQIYFDVSLEAILAYGSCGVYQ